MTIQQSQAIWELCRQGYPLIADEAEKNWEKGETFSLDQYVQISRMLEHLIEHCNHETGSQRSP